MVVKQDGEPFERVSESFDFSNPPFSDEDQSGGPIIARIDYTIEGYLVTIDSWETNWRDEWPLRLAANYLRNCKYREFAGYAIQVPKDAYSFWVSEYYSPFSNDPRTNLYS